MKRALITGISGQDGSYLSEYLLENGYEVFGIIRRHSTPENQENRIAHLGDKVKTFYGDVFGQSSLERIMREVQPDEIYNLAAQSHVRISFDIPAYTFQTNALGVLNMLEAYKEVCPKAKFYQASSSEMFGNSVNENGFQDESTKMIPVSPYGIAKLAGYNFIRHYRNAYKLHAVNGILFNHESPRRGTNFVTNKIVKAAVRISLGMDESVELGNLDSFRDWGHSKDYVRAMHMILNHDEADDFVVATGRTHSVRELCNYVFGSFGLNWTDYVVINDKFKRSEELAYLKGDSHKIKMILNWSPNYTFETLLDEMIKYWVAYYVSVK